MRNALQPSYGGGLGDAFVARIELAGPSLAFSTFLGGSGLDAANALAPGPSGTLLLSGKTDSSNFPVVRPLGSRGGVADAFFAVIAADGSRLLTSTYFGGAQADQAMGVVAVPDGGFVLTGITSSGNFPLVNPEQPNQGGVADAFVTRIGCWIAAAAGPDATTCPGKSIALDGAATIGCPSGASYEWSDPGGTLCGPSPASTCLVTPSLDTTYTLTVTCTGCAASCSDSATVNVRLLPDVAPGDQGNVLYAVRQGSDVGFDFASASALASTWRLYRDDTKLVLGTTALAPDAAITTFTDAGGVSRPPDAGFYRLKGLSPCSGTPGP